MLRLMEQSTINVIFLGTCFAFIFTSYFTISNLEKIFLYSLNHDDPSFTGDGYYSQGCIYAAFSIVLWFGPSVNSVLGSKVTMVLGLLGYEAFILSFFFHITWLIYATSILVGIGAALTWTGQGSYLIQNSKLDTLERNMGIFQILFTSGSVLGNLMIYILFLGKKYIDEGTRNIVIIFLTIILNVGGALLLLLPKPVKPGAPKSKGNEVKQPIAEEDECALEQKNEGAWKSFKKGAQITCTKKYLILCAMFCNIGLSLAFTVIYNSCLGFTNSIPFAKEWVPMAGLVSGVGGIIGGFLPIVIHTEARLPLKIRPLMLIGVIGYAVCYIIAFLSFPDESIFGDTDAVAFIPGNPYLCLFGTFALHLGETLYNCETQTLLAKIFPNDFVPAFAMSFFVKMVFTSVAFNVSNSCGLHMQLLALSIACVLGLLSFAYVALLVERKERDQKEDSLSNNNNNVLDTRKLSRPLEGQDNPVCQMERF